VSARRSQGGFTLVELMVALTLFSVAVAGAMSVAVSMTTGLKDQRTVVTAEASVRGPMDLLAGTFRSASPGVSTGTIQDIATCTTGAITVTNSTSGPDQVDVVTASGSVISTLKSAYSAGGTTLTLADATQFVTGDTLLVTDTSTGHLFVATAVNTSTGAVTVASSSCTPTFPTGGYAAGAIVIKAKRVRYFVDSTGAATDGTPALMIDPDAGGPLAAEPIAAGVEDLQIAVGTDVDGDGAISATEWAFSSGIGALTGSLRAVRITLVARADRELVGGAATFLRPAAEDHPVASTPDRFRRRALTSTIELRNFGGSP